MKRRRSVLKAAKGFRGTRSTKEKLAKENLVKAGQHAFAHRKDKKNDFRRLWHVRLNAALKKHNLSYSSFAGMLKKQNILLNRKMLATIAGEHPESFDRFIKQVTK